MNTHWLVLSNDGWSAFDNEEAASAAHCADIENNRTSYLIHGHTLDAFSADLLYALTHDDDDV